MASLALHQDPAYLGDAPVSGGVDVSQSAGTQGNWPRMIVLDSETEERLRSWIDAELDAFYVERGPMIEDWKRWQTLYWAAPAQKERTFPFKRAANIVIPLAAIAVEATHARFMNTLFTVKPFWSIRARTAEWRDVARPFENYLQSEVDSGETLNMFEFCDEWVMELCKLGTAVVKTGYTKLIKKGLRKEGNSEREVYAVVKNGATIERVPLANYIQRFADTDPQTAPLVGEEHEFTWNQLKRMAQSGRMDGDAIEEIKRQWTLIRQSDDPSTGAEVQKRQEELANAEPYDTATFKVKELYVSFDVDKDGWDEEIVVDYHRATGKFLSIRYNWYEDLHRPYRLVKYLPVEGIWPGIGICKQVEQFQEEATTIHRQRLDNATLANMAQIVIRKGLGYGDKEPIFPGKMWFVDNVQTDIKEFKLSEPYNSSFSNEESVVRYYEKRSGVNEVVLGIPHEGTPGTATSDLTRLAEGNKRFDLVLKNVKRTLSLAGYDVVSNIQFFGNGQIHWITEGDDGIQVEKVLRMPSVLVRRGAIIDLTVSDSITNRDVEQRQWMALFQVLTSFYAQVFQLSAMITQMTGDPGLLMQVAQRTLLAADAALRRLLETFTIVDADEYSLTGKEPYGSQNGGGAGALPQGGTAPLALGPGQAGVV